MVRLNVNGEVRGLDMDPDTPLLWGLRDGLKLTGKPVRSLPVRLHS